VPDFKPKNGSSLYGIELGNDPTLYLSSKNRMDET